MLDDGRNGSVSEMAAAEQLDRYNLGRISSRLARTGVQRNKWGHSPAMPTRIK